MKRILIFILVLFSSGFFSSFYKNSFACKDIFLQSANERTYIQNQGQSATPEVILVNLNHGSGYKSIKPLGCARLTASLKQNNIKVRFIDASYLELSPKELSERIAIIRKEIGERPMLLGFSVLPGDSEYLGSTLSHLPEGLKKDPLVKICAGGYLPTITAPHFMRRFQDVDYIIKVEGDLAIVNLVRAIERNEDLSSVENLVFRTGPGQIKENPHHVLTQEQLDALPSVDYSMVFDERGLFSRKGFIVTSAGCPNCCRYCGIHTGFYREIDSVTKDRLQVKAQKLFWRGRSAKKVVDEIESLYNEYGINGFDIVDDDFIGNNPGRAKDIASEIIKRKLPIKFWMLARARSVLGNKEVFAKLKGAGLVTVFLGIECMNEEQLRFLGKGVTNTQNLKAIETLEGLDIEVRIGFINFYRGSNIRQILINTEFIKQHNLQTRIATPTWKLKIYEGTALYDYYRKEEAATGRIILRPIPKSDTAYDYDIEDTKAAFLYEVTVPLANDSYPFMQHFRELAETKYYTPTTISERAASVYNDLKMLEFGFFERALMIVYGRNEGQLEKEARPAIERLRKEYYAGMVEKIQRFNRWVRSTGYEVAFPEIEKEIRLGFRARLKNLLEKENDAWVFQGDILRLWPKNKVYSEEVMNFFFRIIESSMKDAVDRVTRESSQGYAELLTGDVFVGFLSTSFSEEDVRGIASHTNSFIYERINGRFGFARLEIKEDETGAIETLRNNPSVRAIVTMPSKSGKQFFCLFEKDATANAQEALNSILSETDMNINGTIDFEINIPWVPIGVTKASWISGFNSLSTYFLMEELLKQAAYMQRLAKESVIPVKVGYNSMDPASNPGILTEKEVDSYQSKVQQIRETLSLTRYRVEDIYPCFERITLRALLADTLLQDKRLALFKIETIYRAKNSETETSLLEDLIGSRAMRSTDEGIRLFGFKRVEGINNFKIGNEIILLIADAFNEERSSLHQGLRAHIVRDPADRFYIVLQADRGVKFLTSKQILRILDNAKKRVDEKLNRIHLEVIFEASYAKAKSFNNDTGLLIDMVDDMGEVRTSIKGIKSLPTLNIVKDFKEIEGNPEAMRIFENELNEANDHQRERSKRELLFEQPEIDQKMLEGIMRENSSASRISDSAFLIIEKQKTSIAFLFNIV